MDKIHDPDGRPWISKPVNVAEYFKEFSEKVQSEKPQRDMSDLKTRGMMKLMGLEDEELFNQVEDVMDVSKLTIQDEAEPMVINDPIGDVIHDIHSQVPKFYRTPIPPEACGQLRTLAMQSKWLELTQNDTGAKQRRKRQSRHDNDHWFLSEKPEPKNKNWDLSDRATVYMVRVYRPTKHLVPGQTAMVPIKYTQEVWCLGHHTLADLRDYIWCAADLNIVGAQQVDTVQKPAVRARDRYKSGMMYIGDTFYVDRRDKNNIDYSQVIREWADNPKREVGPFNVDTMETTRLDSLELRIGYPYVYTHQGNHEHLISFIDVRLLAPADPQRVTDYPLIRALGNQAARYCMVCQSSVAVWVTMDNVRTPEDPYFFCGLCYKHFNFVDKKRIGSFKEFRYFDVNVM